MSNSKCEAEVVESLTCKICFNAYDSERHRPQCLVPCGHSYCAWCIGRLRKARCPEDRRAFTTTIPNWHAVGQLGLVAPAPKTTTAERARLLNDSVMRAMRKTRRMYAEAEESAAGKLDEIESGWSERLDELIGKLQKAKQDVEQEIRAGKRALAAEFTKSKEIAKCEAMRHTLELEMNAPGTSKAV